MANRAITLDELKVRLGAVIAELEERGTPFYLTQRGKPKAVLVRYEDYEALLRKVEDLEDILAMKEALSAPESESVSLRECERMAKARLC